MIRTYKYKLRLTSQDREAVEQTLVLCQRLYNGLLEQRKLHYKQAKAQGLKNPTNFYTQSKELPDLKKQCPEYNQVNSQVLQDVTHRLDKTYQNFFKRWKLGLGKGFPRFKSKSQFKSFTHPQFSNSQFDWENSLIRFPGLGWLRFWSDRHAAKQALRGGAIRATSQELISLGAKVKTATIIREPDDFYICLALEIPDSVKISKPVLTAESLGTLKAVGLDMGLKDFAVTDTGQVLGDLTPIKKSEKKIRLTQRVLSRKKKGSHRRAKQRSLLQRQHGRLHRSKKQEIHKISKTLVGTYDIICVEDLDIKGMLSKTPRTAKPSVMTAAAKRGMRRNIGLASWRVLINQIAYKAESAGKFIVRVDPKGTTQECSDCGGYPPTSLPLSVRVYSCTHCQMVKPRDQNAGGNIKHRGLKALLALINQTGCITPTPQKGRRCVASKSHATTPSSEQCEADDRSDLSLKSCK